MKKFHEKNMEGMIFHSSFPLKMEPTSKKLIESSITSNSSFFVMNHGNIPKIDEKNFKLKLILDYESVKCEKQFSMKDLKKFKKTSVEATLVGAGFRRKELSNFKELSCPLEKQIDNAIGNAIFSGCRLDEILKDFGVFEIFQKNQIEISKIYVNFKSLDSVKYSNSIHLSDSSNVLLASQMNHENLLPCHGFPLRVVVPGFAACKSVKWISQITISETEESNFQKFKIPSHKIQWKQPNRLNVNCKILSPNEDEILKRNQIVLFKGISFSGSNQKIQNVFISLDEGDSFELVDELSTNENPNKWIFWKKEIKVPNGVKEFQISCFSIDESYNSQPERLSHIWNENGFMNNSIHRMKWVVQ
jgi:DMSO/TMAO reductase YedYZ molybdopterin-dependent catalytic subunit